MRFRKKPVEIEATCVPHPLNGTNERRHAHVAFQAWMDENAGDREWTIEGNGVDILTPEGTMHGNPGDWIICGVAGEIYPCKPDIFIETYELVE